MYSAFQLARKYFNYYFKAQNGKGHGIHSPFVFDFITHVLNDKKKYNCYSKIESLRKQLLKTSTPIEVEDFGAGSAVLPFKNRKVKDIAKMSALTHKAKASAIVVVEDLNFDSPKTKNLMNILGAVKAADKKIMFITPEYNDNLYKSIRNVPSVLGVLLSDVNTYDIVNSELLVLTEGAAKIFASEESETAVA